MRRVQLVALFGAAAVALLHTANLIGAAYARRAEQGLDRPAADSTRAAAHIAARMSPWSGERAALHAWILAEDRDGQAAAAYRSALRRAPADPILWSEYALALARLDRFDAPLAYALAQAQLRGPTSAAVRSTAAKMGISYWSAGTEAVRSQWLRAMREELQLARATFLARVLARGRAGPFCRGPARELREQSWCDSVARPHDTCITIVGSEIARCPQSP